MKIVARLKSLDASPEVIAWVGQRSPERAWRDCPRGDWLLRVATELGVEHRLIVLAACDCAATSLAFVPAGEARPRLAIETARAWCRGETTPEEVRAAAASAWAAADASAAGAYFGALPERRGAKARAAVIRADALKRCADLVRAQIPWSAIETALATREVKP